MHISLLLTSRWRWRVQCLWQLHTSSLVSICQIFPPTQSHGNLYVLYEVANSHKFIKLFKKPHQEGPSLTPPPKPSHHWGLDKSMNKPPHKKHTNLLWDCFGHTVSDAVCFYAIKFVDGVHENCFLYQHKIHNFCRHGPKMMSRIWWKSDKRPRSVKN